MFPVADLKKTLAVLLDNILQRIGKLESKVDNLVSNGTGTNLTNSTTPVPSLLEKINVAGKHHESVPRRGVKACSELGREPQGHSGCYWCKINPSNLIWSL